jgi:hypothetical protein
MVLTTVTTSDPKDGSHLLRTLRNFNLFSRNLKIFEIICAPFEVIFGKFSYKRDGCWVAFWFCNGLVYRVALEKDSTGLRSWKRFSFLFFIFSKIFKILFTKPQQLNTDFIIPADIVN